MSYISENLLPGETVAIQGEIHWFVYAMPVAMALLGVFYSAQNGMVGGVIVFLAICTAIRGYILIKTTELAVTNKRVIAKFGLISRTTSELNLTKLEGLSVTQSIAGRIFGFGTLSLSGTGGDKVTIPMIDDPFAFRKKALEMGDAIKR